MVAPAHGCIKTKGVHRNTAMTNCTVPHAYSSDHMNFGSYCARFERHGDTSREVSGTLLLFFVFREILLLYFLHSEATMLAPANGCIEIKGIHRSFAMTNCALSHAHPSDDINFGSHYAPFEGHGDTSTAISGTMSLFLFFREILLLYSLH